VLAAGLVTVLVDLVFAQYQGREFLSIYALVVALVVAMIVDLRIFVKT